VTGKCEPYLAGRTWLLTRRILLCFARRFCLLARRGFLGCARLLPGSVFRLAGPRRRRTLLRLGQSDYWQAKHQYRNDCALHALLHRLSRRNVGSPTKVPGAKGGQAALNRRLADRRCSGPAASWELPGQRTQRVTIPPPTRLHLIPCELSDGHGTRQGDCHSLGGIIQPLSSLPLVSVPHWPSLGTDGVGLVPADGVLEGGLRVGRIPGRGQQLGRGKRLVNSQIQPLLCGTSGHSGRNRRAPGRRVIGAHANWEQLRGLAGLRELRRYRPARRGGWC
jgi:hypothetical protein